MSVADNISAGIETLFQRLDCKAYTSYDSLNDKIRIIVQREDGTEVGAHAFAVPTRNSDMDEELRTFFLEVKAVVQP